MARNSQNCNTYLYSGDDYKRNLCEAKVHQGREYERGEDVSRFEDAISIANQGSIEHLACTFSPSIRSKDIKHHVRDTSLCLLLIAKNNYIHC